MKRTGISVGLIFGLLGGCVVTAVCGSVIFVWMLASAVGSQTPAAPVNPYPQSFDDNAPQPEPDLTVATVLAGHRWRVDSPTLVGAILEADFSPDGSFQGMILVPPEEILFAPQAVSGQWTIAGPLLIMDWTWVWDSGPHREQIPIQLTYLSQYSVQGVDENLNLWDFQRID